jgi:hypothetical protein
MVPKAITDAETPMATLTILFMVRPHGYLDEYQANQPQVFPCWEQPERALCGEYTGVPSGAA